MRSKLISIHVPREGDDVQDAYAKQNYANISIHVPREGDDYLDGRVILAINISIHVPREGDDGWRAPPASGTSTFQSTSPVRGTTAPETGTAGAEDEFQSTSPVRGTTGHPGAGRPDHRDFNPRPP